jgi:subtilisin family serine protease
MKKAFPFSKNEILQRVYSVYFDSETLPFVAELATNTTEEFERIIERPKEEKIAVYKPSDYMWQIDMGTWHLKNINADDAWDIAKGSDDVKIAILDTWFDINHPDLENKIYPSYDPYDLTYFNTDCAKDNHGTTVASFAAAETDGGGQLSSVGFDCLIIGYQAWDGDYIERAHHASLAMDADVLTSSAGGWDCRSSSMVDSIEQIAVEEIIANRTVIVMPAGNGINGTHCNYGPWFPLHPAYDSNVIIVTSIGIDNKHYNGADTHSHYGEVDICAPGYYVMGARCTEKNNCDPGVCCIPETWPYYGSCIGTSFATPIVAGTVGLMKSIYPCLNQEEAQRIIKSTATPVEDASSYPGQIGAGVIDAYQCVLATTELATVNYTDTILSSSQTINAFYGIEFDNVSLTEGTHSFNARQELKIIGPFQIDIGVSCTFNADEALSVSCN